MKLRIFVYLICAIMVGLWVYGQHLESKRRLKAQEHFFSYYDRPTIRMWSESYRKMIWMNLMEDADILTLSTDALIKGDGTFTLPTSPPSEPDMIPDGMGGYMKYSPSSKAKRQ